MTPENIKALFEQAIEEKAIYNQLSRITENQIYNWRKGRGRAATIGEMLEVLYEIDAVDVHLSEEELVIDPSLQALGDEIIEGTWGHNVEIDGSGKVVKDYFIKNEYTQKP